MAIATAGRRAHGDEDRVRIVDGRAKVVAEGQAIGANVVGDQLVEARFVDWHLACSQTGDLGRILVDAHHVMAELCKAGAGDEPDIA